jgi:hypothetical protein
MPQSATHAFTGSDTRAPAKTPGRKAAPDDPAEAVELLLGSPPGSLVIDPRAERDVLRRSLHEQQRALRRSLAAAAECDKNASASAAEAAKFRNQLQALERELQGEKLSRARQVSTLEEEAARLRQGLEVVSAAHARQSRARRVEKRVFGVLSSALAGLAALLGGVLWCPRPPHIAPNLTEQPRPVAASTTGSDTTGKPASERNLGRLRQALALLPSDTVRQALQEGGGAGCSIGPTDEMALLVGKDADERNLLAAALAKCLERLERPLH